MLEYIELMYRDPSRGPCIETIYPTLLGFGGIHGIILSYPLSYTETKSVSNKPSLTRRYTLEPTSYSLQRVNPHTKLLKLQGCFPKHVQSYAAIVMSNTIRQLLSTRATSEPAKGGNLRYNRNNLREIVETLQKSTINQSVP